MIIYKTTNLINNKIYIGKTTTEDPNYYGSGIVIKQALEKYGKENFKREIIDQADSPDELNEKEIYWIKFYDSCNRDIGYNRSHGGDGFIGITEETIEKIQKSRSWYKHHSDETKQKMSDASKGKPKSDAHKKALSEAWEKRKIEKPCTEETRKKRSKSLKGKNKGKYIKVYKFEDCNGVIYETTEGFVKFAKSIHIHPKTLRELINGDREEYKGWKYIETIKV